MDIDLNSSICQIEAAQKFGDPVESESPKISKRGKISDCSKGKKGKPK